MPEPVDLIATLQESLKHTKTALDNRVNRKSELQNQDNLSVEEFERLDVEIMTLKQAFSQTEQAISSVSKWKENGETNDFGLGFKQM
jgi:uncharacterized membrane protein YccC